MENKSSTKTITETTTAVKPAAIWARVSTQGQAETSLPSQISRCKEKLEQEGYSVTHTLAVDWTSLDLFSCPQFLELQGLIRSREIEALAVFDRDRLEAKGLQRLVFLSECKEAGVKLIICQGPPMLDEPEGQLVELALAIGKERQVLRARQGSKDGLHDRATKRGLPTTYHKLYGYQWDKENNQLVPNNDYPTLKLIFDMLLDGESYHPIIQELKKRGISSPSGQPEWNKTAISNIVHNPAYAGRYFSLRKVAVPPKKRKLGSYGNSSVRYLPLDQAHYMQNIEIVNPPITWDQRGKILDQLAQHQKLAQRNAQRDYLLRGFIFCDTHTGKQGEPRRYHGQPHHASWRYTCPVGGCPQPYLDGPSLEAAVKDNVTDMLYAQRGDLYRLLNTKQGKKALERQLKEELETIELRYNKALLLQAQTEERFMNGEIDPEIYPMLRAKYKTQRQGAETRKNEILDELGQLGREREAILKLKELRQQFASMKKLNNADWRQLFSILNLEVHIAKPGDYKRTAHLLHKMAHAHGTRGAASFMVETGITMVLGIPLESRQVWGIALRNPEPD